MDCLDSAFYLRTQTALCNLADYFLVKCFATHLPLLDYLLADLLPAHVNKRCDMGKCKGLSAILVTCYLRHDLCCDITCSEEAVRLLNHCLADNGSVLQHILQIHEVAVMFPLCEIIRIMEMDDSLLMCFHNLFRKQHTLRQIFADLACHIITLG